MDKNRNVISLFSGAMGLDIGLARAGLNIVIGQDFDKSCVETMQANGHEVLCGDIREIKAPDLLAETGMKVGEPFLICGGPPCQPFSTAGKRLGIISSPLKHVPIEERDGSDPEQQLGTVLDVILNEFNKLNYKTVYGVLDAVNYGVPQFRERFVLIGSRDNEDIFLPVPTHFAVHQNEKYKWQSLSSAIRDIEDAPGICESFSQERLKYLRLVPEGGNWRSLPEEMIEEAMGGAYRSGGGKVGFYRRLSYSEPCTVK